MTAPSRLYRKLRPIAAAPSLFQIAYGEGLNEVVYDDRAISSITIHRGAAGPEGGIPGVTFEATVPRRVESLMGKDITLTLQPAAVLSAYTGASISPVRFRGRTVGFSFEDQPTSRANTSIAASSWTAIVPHHSARFSRPATTAVTALLGDALRPPTNYPLAPLRFPGTLNDYGRLAAPIVAMSISDIIGEYVEAPSFLVRDRHTGETEVLSLPYRRSTALAGLDVALPLNRGQVLSPSQREHSVWENKRTYRITTAANYTGGTIGAQWNTGTEGWRTAEDIDLTHILFPNETSWRTLGASLSAREQDRAYSLPSVRVDLLQLLSSARPSDRQQAGQLLALQHGDPVYLSPDWDTGARGIHFAQEITETITPAGWWLDLALTPYAHITGEASPIPRGRIWDSQLGIWDSRTEQWNTI